MGYNLIGDKTSYDLTSHNAIRAYSGMVDGSASSFYQGNVLGLSTLPKDSYGKQPLTSSLYHQINRSDRRTGLRDTRTELERRQLADRILREIIYHRPERN